MVVTEENVAAHAFAEHFEQRRKGARTPLIYLCKTATITSTDFAHWVRWWIPTRVRATL